MHLDYPSPVSYAQIVCLEADICDRQKRVQTRVGGSHCVGYGLLKIGVINGRGLLSYAVVLSFTPILFAPLGSRFIKPELLRPTLAP